MNISGSLASALLLTLAGSGAAIGAFSDQDDRAFSGTIACGGNHFFRMNGTEAHNTRYILRNYGDLPVRIEQLTLYDANGVVLFAADGATLPLFRNGVLGPGDNALNPKETAQLNTEDILPSGLTETERPIQLIIDWAADRKTLIPEFVWVRNTLAREQRPDGTFRFRESRSRHLNNCRSISADQGRKHGKRHGDHD